MFVVFGVDVRDWLGVDKDMRKAEKYYASAYYAVAVLARNNEAPAAFWRAFAYEMGRGGMSENRLSAFQIANELL